MRVMMSAWIAAMILVSPATAKENGANPVGLYRAQEGPDVGSLLAIRPDGRFGYEFYAGAFEQWALGNWSRVPASDSIIRLRTLPRPKAPVFRIDSMGKGENTVDASPLTLHVAWPNGNGVSGIDFRIEYENGETATGYTQNGEWRADPAEQRRARWIELLEPVYDIALPRTAIPEGATDLRFTLIPNDMKIADFADSEAEFDGERLTLHSRNGDIRYVRIKGPEEIEAEPESGTPE